MSVPPVASTKMHAVSIQSVRDVEAYNLEPSDLKWLIVEQGAVTSPVLANCGMMSSVMAVSGPNVILVRQVALTA